MKPIDKKEARIRIMKALVKGHVDQYGQRRMVEHEREVMVSPGHRWDKDAEWVDPGGVKRKGRFVPLPPVKRTQHYQVPQGVVPAQIAEWAHAVSGGFMEVLNIIEEALRELPDEEAREAIQDMKEAAGG